MAESRAYPVKSGDVIVNCPVCRKQVAMVRVVANIYEVLYHNAPDGSACNGTARRGALTHNPSE